MDRRIFKKEILEKKWKQCYFFCVYWIFLICYINLFLLLFFLRTKQMQWSVYYKSLKDGFLRYLLPEDMNDIAPSHPARHIPSHSQSELRAFWLKHPYPIKMLQLTNSPAFTQSASNQSRAFFTNSLHRKGEWRSYCRSVSSSMPFLVWPKTLFPL